MSDAYWAGRCGLRYYKLVRHYLEELSPGHLLIDVGSSDTPVVTYGDFRHRMAIDLHRPSDCPGVESIIGDWMSVCLAEPASVLTCLQVLEHLPDERLAPFVTKLLRSAARVIVSVPYLWPHGQDRDHLQDPIDEVRLAEIMGCDPLESLIVTEQPNRVSQRRLIALYQGKG